MSVLPVGIGPVTSTEYQIERSLRFNSADSAYLSRTPSVAGNRTTWTWSGWVKRSSLIASRILGSYTSAGSYEEIVFTTNNELQWYTWRSSNYGYNKVTTQLFRDISSWYHIQCTFDSGNATQSSRQRIYINGNIVTTFSANTEPSLNVTSDMNNNVATAIGTIPSFLGSYYNGYMTEMNFIDGQALTPSSFGETDPNTGVWRPKKYTGTYGTNGFYLNFKDNSAATATTLGKDYSGNNNNWTPNAFTVIAGVGNDSMVDTPTPYGTDTGLGGQVRGNYATLNPLHVGGACTFSNGNLQSVIPTGTNGFGTVTGTIAINSGKHYWEVTGLTSTAFFLDIGIVATSINASSMSTWKTGGVAYSYYNGTKYVNGSNSAYGASYTYTDIIGVALDVTGGTITFYKNNISQGAITLPSGYAAWYPAVSTDTNSAATDLVINFGQRPFAYQAPSGFKALCTTNLPTPTIVKPTEHNNSVTYSGSSSPVTITGLGHRPSSLLIKSRNNPYDNVWFNSVRGLNLYIIPSASSPENNLGSFITTSTDGFTVPVNGYVNSTDSTYAAWTWKLNNSTVSNTQGSITSTVDANSTAGYSIVRYTGTGASATVGHGLGNAPKFIFVKSIQSGDGIIYHSGLTSASNAIQFNQSVELAGSNAYWNGTAPTSNVFSIGTDFRLNNSGNLYIAHCFAEIPGYSSIGNYTGNGSTDGPFVYTGFRPSFVLIKNRTTTSTNWVLFDNKRLGYNVDNNYLSPSDSIIENTTDLVDILSNGFKIRSTASIVNASSAVMIYMAFAETPFKYSLAR